MRNAGTYALKLASGHGAFVLREYSVLFLAQPFEPFEIIFFEDRPHIQNVRGEARPFRQGLVFFSFPPFYSPHHVLYVPALCVAKVGFDFFELHAVHC